MIRHLMTDNNKQQKEIEKSKDGDIVQNSIGVLGPWQKWMCLLICLVKFSVAWQQLSIVFLAPPADFTCTNNVTDKCSTECGEHIFDREIFSETIITTWDLVCERSQLASITQLITMLGILFGNMGFGYFSDRFGRRLPLCAAVVLQIISGIIAAYSPWFLLFLVMRFVSAVATGGAMVVSFVLVMEIIGVKWRTFIGIIYQIPFNLGHLTLPLFSYYIRDWRMFQMAITIPNFLLLSYYCLLPESPRWLLTTGKEEQAVKMMQNAAKHNKLPTENIKSDIRGYLAKKETEAGEGTELQANAGNIVDLVRTSIMRTYTFCVGFNWLVCGLCFFGVAQYIGHLSGNIFVNVAFSAVIQIPGTFFAIWSVKTLGRKITLILANLVGGLSLLTIIFLPVHPSWIRATISCIGMLGFSVSFPTVYIYSGELFPTKIRNVGVGTSSMCARIGSMTAPFIATLGHVVDWLPPLVFGIIPIIGAILCLQLPETVDCKLPDTVQEAELLRHRKWKSMAFKEHETNEN